MPWWVARVSWNGVATGAIVRIAGDEVVLFGADTLFLVQSLAQKLTADTAQLTHKSSGYGETAEAYRQVERTALRSRPEVLMFDLEMRVDRSV